MKSKIVALQPLPVSTGSPPGKGTPLQSDLRQLQEHHIKINVLPADAEEGREGAQLPEAEFFIQPDGADIVAAHLDIELGKAVFPRKARTASVRAEAVPQPHHARFRLMPNTPRWRIRPGLRFRLAVPMSSPSTLARYCTWSGESTCVRR